MGVEIVPAGQLEAQRHTCSIGLSRVDFNPAPATLKVP